ncbi:MULTISPECIES: hypothetical protein [unclassified Micromonospora]|uniref:hypothetical protein n=1 Tax=unclassified Micromonospora TaxID=2617518 RepID=UPI00104BC93E|nr:MULTISPECIES: hypothetical protein [unclassified Micromonospora]TDB79976.1 hypothetical protein E1182_10570 [Micromonospora sp. KC721]TDC41207.1 hypothetical protein E1166_12445 [Micromonospora sp. KC213]
MTDLHPTDDERELLRRAAAAHTAAARDVEAFLRRLPEVPDPTDVTEYATLLSREERTLADRQSAATAAGLQLPSLES